MAYTLLIKKDPNGIHVIYNKTPKSEHTVGKVKEEWEREHLKFPFYYYLDMQKVVEKVFEESCMSKNKFNEVLDTDGFEVDCVLIDAGKNYAYFLNKEDKDVDAIWNEMYGVLTGGTNSGLYPMYLDKLKSKFNITKKEK